MNASSLSALQKNLLEINGPLIQELLIEHNQILLKIDPKDLFEQLRSLKENDLFKFNLLIDITAVDWLDIRPLRFEIVYQLLSLPQKNRLTIKTALSEDNSEIDSLTPLWSSANFLEREVWDMFGVLFKGHPNLKRILMYEEFVGHPLRKDYPVQGKQPRTKLRSPEVQNTARQMHRAELVQIRAKSI